MAKATENKVAVSIYATCAHVKACLPEGVHINEAELNDLCDWLCGDYEVGECFFETVSDSVQRWVDARQAEQEVPAAAEATGSGQMAQPGT
jgi:hypothetical protein